MRGSPWKWGSVFLKYGEETPPKWLQGSEGPLPEMGVMAVRDAPKMAPEECWARPQNGLETPPKVYWRVAKDPRSKMAAGPPKMGRDPRPKMAEGNPKNRERPLPKTGPGPSWRLWWEGPRGMLGVGVWRSVVSRACWEL